MTWQVWGRQFESGELSNLAMYQAFKATDNSMIVRAVRTELLFYNDPVFADLTCKLYAVDSNTVEYTPTTLIAASTSTYNKADIYTEDYALSDLYFEFNDIQLPKDVYFAVVLSASSYTPTGSSYIVWKNKWPNPVNNGYIANIGNMTIAPFNISFIGAAL